jgi:hypothetical protein
MIMQFPLLVLIYPLCDKVTSYSEIQITTFIGFFLDESGLYGKQFPMKRILEICLGLYRTVYAQNKLQRALKIAACRF